MNIVGIWGVRKSAEQAWCESLKTAADDRPILREVPCVTPSVQSALHRSVALIVLDCVHPVKPFVRHEVQGEKHCGPENATEHQFAAALEHHEEQDRGECEVAGPGIGSDHGHHR